ncbi:MAG: HPr family phosphocarrier protein [Candidatus Omnitrophota bacterium]|nr:HPr family phosphocarrier protein [Candidatus Omnitrophota bacterium]
MKSVNKKIVVCNKQGLHARPAALFVQVASRFDCRITVTKDGEVVNGKSIMGILMLGAAKGSEVVIEAIGDDAEEALLELEKLLVQDE